jgi:hypothetical protein
MMTSPADLLVCDKSYPTMVRKHSRTWLIHASLSTILVERGRRDADISEGGGRIGCRDDAGGSVDARLQDEFDVTEGNVTNSDLDRDQPQFIVDFGAGPANRLHEAADPGE